MPDFSALITKIKQRRFLITILAVLAIGAFLHFRNLNDAIYLDEDEARAFQLLSSGPLIYLLCKPFFDLTLTQAPAFYVAASFGFVSIILFYFLCRSAFNKRIAIYAVLIYALYPLRIDYARTLYPAVFIDFFFLLALFFAYLGLLRKQVWFAFIAGIFSACIFHVHYVGYALIAGILIFYLYYFMRHRIKGSIALKTFLRFFCGFLSAYFVFQLVLLAVKKDYFYAQQLFSFYDIELTSAKVYVKELPLFIMKLFSRVTASFFGILISVITIFALVFVGIKKNSKERAQNILLFSIPYISATSLLVLMAVLRLHSIKERHFIWLVAPFSVSIAFLFTYFLDKLKGLKKTTLVFLFVAFCLGLFINSYWITKETFTNRPMNSFLRERNIRKSEILTFWDLYVYKDNELIYAIPCYFVNSKVQDTRFWFVNNPEFKIYWPGVFMMYKIKNAKYIITSGISARSTLGEDDSWLQNVRPLASWLHPYTEFRHRFFYSKTPHYINIYKLEDVFSYDNPAFLFANDMRDFKQGRR